MILFTTIIQGIFMMLGLLVGIATMGLIVVNVLTGFNLFGFFGGFAVSIFGFAVAGIFLAMAGD